MINEIDWTARESAARSAWRDVLAELLALPIHSRSSPATLVTWDDLLEAGEHLLAVEFKPRSDAATLWNAFHQIEKRALPSAARPLLAVSQMGETGRELCRERGIDWIDLAGNASITHIPGIRILVEGKKPQRRVVGRKPNVFATKSSRVAHWLLLHPEEVHSRRDIVKFTGIDGGHLTRILARMEEVRLVRNVANGIQLVDARIMLEAWREAYEPPCGIITKGVVPSRSGEETMRRVSDTFLAAGRKHVISGLAAAWKLDGFADFRTTTCYLEGAASGDLLRSMNFVETDRGANVWIMQEADKVAFLGAQSIDGVPLASPWFTYVDLSNHPERAKEAAEHLRSNVLHMEATDGK